MKKQLLLGTALLAAMGVFSQTARVVPKGVALQAQEGAERANKRIFTDINRVDKVQPSTNTTPAKPQSRVKATANPTTTTWQPISGSMNVYGVLNSNSRPLGFNDELNAVSFVHRKSASYVTYPVPTTTGAISGVIVAAWSDDFGTTWDSTCIWNNSVYWARYPQGGLYNPPPGSQGVNKDIQNAYVLGGGPVTTAQSNWAGSFLANKKLDVFGGAGNDSIASPTNTLFVSNTTINQNTGKFDFPSTHFQYTDDGVVRFPGIIVKNYNGTTSADFGFRGTRIIKGQFNPNTNDFDWSGNMQNDSIMFTNAVQNSGNYAMAYARAHQCWSEDGQTGYVWFIQTKNTETATPMNMGYQPSVWLTKDGGNSWTEQSRIRFEDTVKYGSKVLSHLFAARNSTFAIPFFSDDEGMDAIVDRHGDLHILTTLNSTFSRFPDSLGYRYQYNASSSADGQTYLFGHRPGQRPYIYDFVFTQDSGWNVLVVDTMSSEAPGTSSSDAGYQDNPWDATGGTSGTDKVESNARLQWSSTPDGQHLVATWAESDTLFTNSQHKWNALPDVKAKLISVGPKSSSAPLLSRYTIHPNKLNITNPTSGTPNVLVAGRASMHYVSSRCMNVSTTGTSVCIGLPMTVSNNQNTPMQQLSSVTHWYSSAVLNFDNVNKTNIVFPVSKRNEVGVNEHSSELNYVGIYPNPASGSVMVGIKSLVAADANITVMNAVGQVVLISKTSLHNGNNTIGLNIQSLPTGIYMVTVKAGNSSTTKKLIVE